MAKLTLVRTGLPRDSCLLNSPEGPIVLKRGEPMEVSVELALNYLGSSEYEVEISSSELDTVENYQLENLVREGNTVLASVETIKGTFKPKKKPSLIDKVTKPKKVSVKKEEPKPKVTSFTEETVQETVSEESSDEAVLANDSE